MQGKVVCVLVFVAIVVIIGPASGCKLCGVPWCACGNSHRESPQYSRPCGFDHGSTALHLTVPISRPSSLLGLGLGGGSVGLGGLGGGSFCHHCGGYKHPHPGCSSREDYGGYSRGYTCRCTPRRNRYRYDDY